MDIASIQNDVESLKGIISECDAVIANRDVIIVDLQQHIYGPVPESREYFLGKIWMLTYIRRHLHWMRPDGLSALPALIAYSASAATV
jgi:hypothetical protein